MAYTRSVHPLFMQRLVDRLTAANVLFTMDFKGQGKPISFTVHNRETLDRAVDLLGGAALRGASNPKEAD